MKLEIAKDELQEIRDIIWEGRAYYSKRIANDFEQEMVLSRNRIKIGTKLIKKLNAMLKKVHGHDCNGEAYF